MKSKLGQIHNQDCISGMNALPEGAVDLVFADPPFNIGYKYDVYEDKLAAEDYLNWSREWMTAAYRALKSNGTFWLAIGDDFAAELKIEAQKIGFHCRSWVIWYYTFGVNCKNKFTRSHTHLFHFVKDAKDFTFRIDDLKNRVPSARALVYSDKRAKGSGRLPDDTWMIPPFTDQDFWEASPESQSAEVSDTFLLRPQELSDGFRPDEDTWYIPRVAGTFKERAGFHGCQMPEQLLGRIIRTCSEDNDIVLDPFSGSASTLVVARKLGRRFIGFELSPEYVADGRARLNATSMGDPLDGSPEPTMEAFKLAAQKKNKGELTKRGKSSGFAHAAESDVEENDIRNVVKQVESGLIAAFKAAHNGFSTDVVLTDPDLNAQFVDECVRLGLPGEARLWNHNLLRIRKRSKVKELKAARRFSIPFAECEPFLFASEAAWKIIVDEQKAKSLDEILCDPELAAYFDELAAGFSPGFTSLQYRWGGLRIRKYAKVAKRKAAVLQQSYKQRNKLNLSKRTAVEKIEQTIPNSSCVYLISEGRRRLYVGGTFTGRDRLISMLEPARRERWVQDGSELSIQYFETGNTQQDLIAWTSYIMSEKALPKYNVADLQVVS